MLPTLPQVTQVFPLKSSPLPLIVLVSDGPRKKLRGFDDPPFSKLEPTWYLHPPPSYVRQAAEEQGLKWDQVVNDLEARRNAFVDGQEWDVDFSSGKIVWNKPTMEQLKESYKQHEELKQWGEGWRRWVVWAVWKVIGSPEGVFETVDGKVDGRLVLRQVKEAKVPKTLMTGAEAKKDEEKRS